MKYIICVLSMLIISTLSYAQAYASDFTSNQIDVVKDIIWAAKLVGVKPMTLLAICFTEGSFKSDKSLTHMDGGSLSHGTCQVKFSTAQYMDKVYKHRHAVTEDTLEDPRINALYSAKYLKYQLKRYNNAMLLAIDAYNKHNARSENSEYVRKVKLSYKLITEALPDSLLRRAGYDVR